MRRRARRAGALALVLALVGLAACGVPTESKARAIASDQEISDVTTPTTPSGPTARSVELYLVDNDRLSPVDRPVEQAPDVTVAVTQLLSGATAADKARGLVSAIPPETSALSVRVANGVLTLDLSEQFKPVGDTYLKACAQIVFTVTAIEGITSVRFLVEGDPINPPTVDDGNLAEVSRRNYRTLAP